MRWQWDEAGPSPSADECIRDFSQTGVNAPNPEPSSVNAAFSGAWYEPAVDGFGATLNVALTSEAGSVRYLETTAISVFDDAGNPVWLMGQLPLNASAAPLNSSETHSLTVRFAGPGYPIGVPTSDCIDGQNCVDVISDVGTWSRSFASTTAGWGGVETALTSARLSARFGQSYSGAAVTRFDRPNAGVGTIDRDGDGDPDPMVGIVPVPGYGVGITKLTSADQVVVNLTHCVAPSASTSCQIEVNWSARPGLTNVSVFRKSLTPSGTAPVLLATADHGERSESIMAGHRIEFQLRAGNQANSPLLARSPPITAVSNQPPTVTLTSPSAGMTFFAPASIALAATASDTDGTITKVEFLVNNMVKATVTSPPYVYAWSSVAAGTYSVTARATDNAGAPTTATPLSVVVSQPASAAMPSPDSVSDSVGATTGESRVDESGAATYMLPLYAAPGTAGVAPQLSLSYSSQAPSGPMGRGWSISGISSITRCRATVEAADADGVNAPPVNLTSSDRFCLDGQRLLSVADAPACPVWGGASVSQLRTEIEGFQRVCAYTLIANPSAGPRFFSVEGKDGSKQWFGDRRALSALTYYAEPTGFLEANGAGQNGAAYQWALVRSQDSSGNYIDYTYLKNPGGASQPGEQLLAKASYTGKLVLPGQGGTPTVPYAEINFEYGVDPLLLAKGYFLGNERWRTRRLESVRSSADGVMLRHYRIGYSPPPNGSREPQLTSVTECRDDATNAVCLPATRFDWSAAEHGFSSLRPATGTDAAIINAGSLTKFEGYKYGDVNGDGRPDLVWVKDQLNGDVPCVTESIVISLAQTDSSGGLSFESRPMNSFCAPREFIRDSQNGTDSNWFLLDYDGDGRDDLFIRGVSGWEGHRAVSIVVNGTQTSSFESANLLTGAAGLVTPIPIGTRADEQPQLSDVNGDGLTDLLYASGGQVFARLMERSSANVGLGAYRWGEPWQVTVPTATMCPMGQPNCDIEIGGLYRKRNYQQVNDFNGDARSDLMLVVRVITVGNNLPSPVPSDGPPVITEEQFAAAATHAPTPAGSVSQVVPWVYAMTVKGFHQPKTEGGVGTIETEEFGNARWPNAYFQGVSFTDINGDGLTDYFNHAESTGVPVFAVNTGLGFAPPVLLSGVPAAGYDENHQRKYIQMLDINGDGRADMVFPQQAGGRFITRLALADGGFSGETMPPNGVNLATNCANDIDISGCLKQRSSQFGDYDGDGALDYLQLSFSGTSDLKYRAALASHRQQPRNVITRVTNGFGAVTEFSYLPLTNRAVYRPDVGSRNTLAIGRGSPASDLRAPMYVVHRVSSSAPTLTQPLARSEVFYRYVGAKLQAGGRGFLGFREIHSIDPNHSSLGGPPSAHVATVTRYRQDFPYNGRPDETTVLFIPSPFTDDACANVGTSAPNVSPPNACYLASSSVASQPFTYVGSRLLSVAKNTWIVDGTSVSAFVPQRVYLQRASEIKYDLVTIGLFLSQTVTENADFDAYGNVRTTRACTYGSSGNSTCPTGPVGSALAKTETASTYADDAARWRLGRLMTTAITFKRTGQTDVTRRTDYAYDMGGAFTGLLTTEKVQAASGDATQALATYYVLDAYGNRTGKHTCNASMAEATCRSTAITFSTDSNDTHVQRYERHTMDTLGRFMTATYAPFANGATGSVELQTSTVLTRNAFGDVTHARDLNGVDVHSVAGVLGRPYYTWTETVQGGGAGNAQHGVETRATFRWCAGFGSGGNSVACPEGAVYREEMRSSGKPTQWSYVDVLGRPMMSVTESLVSVSAGDATRYSAACSFYDSQGRMSDASVPFFLSASEGTTPAPSPQSSACEWSAGRYASTAFDPLSRPIFAVAADDSAVSYDYTGLTTTFYDALSKTRVEQKNALGELSTSRDAMGLITSYVYDAAGNLTSVSRNGGSGAIVSSMGYDSMGRKTSSQDPDAGSWTYRYNALGELVQQAPTTSAVRRTEQRYDARGRMFLRRVYSDTGTLETTHQFTFDSALDGRGQLASESVSGTYRAWVTDSTLASQFSRSYTYDNLGRPQGTTTMIDNIGYYTAVEYDALSRAWKVQDVSGRWLKSEYTAQGHMAAQCESSFGDSTPTCAQADANTYVRTLAVDARGNVTFERRGGSLGLEVSRRFNAQNGRLERICSGNQVGCSVQLAEYDWDVQGNLRWRDIAGQYREAFTYDDNHRLKTGKYTRLLNGALLPDAQHITSLQHDYDQLGNVCRKLIGSALVNYRYGAGSGCGAAGVAGTAGTGTRPHAVNQVGARTYAYDNQGNQTLSQGETAQRMIQYSGEQQAYQVEVGTGSTSSLTRFWYGSDGARYKREDRQNGGPFKRTLYLGNVEIIQVGGVTTTKRYLAGVAVQDIVGTSGTPTTRYLFHDHLGSVVRVTNASGGVESGMDFGPFGERRGYADPRNTPIVPQATTRGFTGHEMVDGMDIVHMNGRIYDSRIARFLQADPIIQEPNNPQNFNRYSYVFNNPLNATDPTGYMSQGWRQAISAIITIVAIVTQQYWLGANATWGTVASYYAAVGAVSGGISTGTWNGAAWGAVSGFALSSVGSLNYATNYGRALSMGFTNGSISALQGGKFGHGFASASLSSLAGGRIDAKNPVVGTMKAALVGGTISAVTGGKFANGAVTAAFSYALSSAAGRGLATGSGDGPVSGANDFDVTLSRSYGSRDAAAIGFGDDYGPGGIRDQIEYNTAIVETFGADGYGPPAYSYTSPLAGDVGAKTVPLRTYLRAVAGAHGARNVVAIAHNHFDNNPKFTGIGLDTSVAQIKPLYVYNRAGETRLLNSAIIQREIAGVRGANALQSHINANNGMNGRCINGCR